MLAFVLFNMNMTLDMNINNNVLKYSKEFLAVFSFNIGYIIDINYCKNI